MDNTRRLAARTVALAVAGAGGGYLIANAYVSYRFGGALTYFEPLFLARNVEPIYERAPEEFWTSAAIIGGFTGALPVVPMILTAAGRAREAATRARKGGSTLNTKGGAVAGAVAFGTFGAALGYTIASTYVTYSFGGSISEPDFGFLAQNVVPLYHRAPQTFWTAATIIAGFTLAPLGMVSAMALNEKLTTYGTTDFQTPTQMKKNGFLMQPGHGFILGKLGSPRSRQPFIVSETFPHAMMIAPTGRGKGVGFVIPNLLIFKGSVVVLDPKGENFEATARHRRSMGDRVIRFAPLDWSGKSHRYNPLERISKMENPDQRMAALKKMGRLILQAEENVQGLLKGGLDIWTACGLLAFERGTPTIGAIYKLAVAGGDKKKAYSDLAWQVQYEPAQEIFENLGSLNDKTLTSYLSVLGTSGLDLWSNPHMQRVTSGSDFSFSDIRRYPHAIYFDVPFDDIEEVAPLARLFFADLISTLQAKQPGQDEPGAVMIVLDEFHKLGKMPIVADSISTLRSFGGHLAIITQSIPQLDEVYGKNTRLTLQAGAGIKVYYTPSDELTVAEVSAALGKTTKRIVSKSRPLGMSPLRSRTVSERTEEAPLMTEDQVRRMSLDEVLILKDATMPIRARRIEYFKDPVLKRIYNAQKGELPWPPILTAAKPTPSVPAASEHSVVEAIAPLPPVPNGGALTAPQPASVEQARAEVVPQVPVAPQAAPAQPARPTAPEPSPQRIITQEEAVALARRAALRRARPIAFMQPLDTVISPEIVAALRESSRRIRALHGLPAAVPTAPTTPAEAPELVASDIRTKVRRAKVINVVKFRDDVMKPEHADAIRSASGKMVRLDTLLATDPDLLEP